MLGMRDIQGYEPGGSLLPGRNYSSSSYNYGFNGMRKDDEIHGATGTSYDFGARLYDPRVGRWLSLDPSARNFPNQSPYSAFANNPVLFVDPDGEAIKPSNATTAASFRRMLGTVLGVSPREAARIFKLNYENRRFRGENGSTYVQAVFSVDGSTDAARRFTNQLARINGLTAEQADQAVAIYNLLADSRTTELLSVQSGDVAFSGTVPVNNDMSIPPDNQPIVTIAENGSLDQLKSALPTADPGTFQSELARRATVNTSAVDPETRTGVAGGFFAESSSSPNAETLRGMLIVDTRDGSQFTGGKQPPPASDATRDRMNAAVLQGYESSLRSSSRSYSPRISRDR